MSHKKGELMTNDTIPTLQFVVCLAMGISDGVAGAVTFTETETLSTTGYKFLYILNALRIYDTINFVWQFLTLFVVKLQSAFVHSGSFGPQSD